MNMRNNNIEELLKEISDKIQLNTDLSIWRFPLSDYYDPIYTDREAVLTPGQTIDAINLKESGMLHGPAFLVTNSPSVNMTITLQTEDYYWEVTGTIATWQALGRWTPMQNGIWIDAYDTNNNVYMMTGSFLFLPYKTSIRVQLGNEGATNATATFRCLRYKCLEEPRRLG